jgi:branched-subunit amino acid transport protein
MTDLWTMAVIVGLAVVTVITRGFFVFSSRPWRLPAWAERGLQYAPIAALTAVVVPEVVMTQGHLIATWQDARIFGAAAGILLATQHLADHRRGHGRVSALAPGAGLVSPVEPEAS